MQKVKSGVFGRLVGLFDQMVDQFEDFLQTNSGSEVIAPKT
jgi:hypothetical protein